VNITNLLNSISAARMEYESFGNSVLDRFVVPFKIDELDLRNQKLSMALVGSRGSGKSTYIQYFSHSTRFDKKNKSIDRSEFDCIVLYWKPDIAYCQGLNGKWLGDSNASSFFKMHASIELIEEFIRMLTNVKHHFPKELEQITQSNSNFLRGLNIVSKSKIENIEQMFQWVDDQRFDLSTRLNPINLDGMLSLDPKETLSYLIKSLERDCQIFSNTQFKVFVDEFELLNISQQRLINSYRKESKAKVSWNVAYKLHAKPTPETLSDQPLQEPDDFRTQVLDNLIKENFELYAAEIFLLSIKAAGIECPESSISSSFLGDRGRVKERLAQKYRDNTLAAIKSLFPTPSVKDLSSKYLNKDWLQKKLAEIIKSEGRPIELTKTILEDPSLAVTIVGTYRQKSFDLDAYLEGRAKEKVGTYEFNSLLTFRNQNSNLNLPIYSGFERFITMTTPNVRHFKELCFGSLKQLDEELKVKTIKTFEDIPPVSPEKMDIAAVTTSKLLTDEVISYPPYGNKLYTLVNRIGELFKMSQKSSYQSEPERVIFSIKYDYANTDPELEKILSAGECWKILTSDDSKRLKSENQITSKEYRLSPIYSPRFGISYRKKRGITFELSEFKTLINGTYEEFDAIRDKYRKIWRSEEKDVVVDEEHLIKDQGKLI
jgi:hypothetical protein